LENGNHELLLIGDWNNPPKFRVPISSIKDIKIVAADSGTFRVKNNLMLSIFMLSISFSTNDKVTQLIASPISFGTNQESIQTIELDVKDKEINSLLEQIKTLKNGWR
jgi:hypothetical protein